MKFSPLMTVSVVTVLQTVVAVLAWWHFGVPVFVLVFFTLPIIALMLFVFKDTRHVKKELNSSRSKAFEAENQLEMLRQGVNQDPLTGLHSRTYIRARLDEILELAIKRQTPCAVLYLDLDFFKELNEALGQQSGNELLVQLASRLQSIIKKGDLLGYYGADEFMVILPKINNMMGAELVARRILNEMVSPFNLDNHPISVTVSIGIALGPLDAQDSETLIARAETALRSAKGSGRRGYSFYSQQLNQNAAQRLKVDQLLRGALERNEFSIRYQPIVSEQGTNLKGFEALIRWNNPEVGMLSPTVFIPIAEQIGIVSDLGTWILRESVQQLKIWQLKYQKRIVMSVNVSPRQFQDKSILPAVKSVIQQTGIQPDTLQLEVTEGLFLSASEQLLNSIDMLKQSGIRLALDDFGTGFSSLSYLNRLPFDVLKVDKSFVDGIVANDRDRKMIRSIIAIGHGLNMEIIVEGVESPQQVHQLHALKADSLQGFYYSKPLTAQEAEARFLNRGKIMEMDEKIWDRL